MLSITSFSGITHDLPYLKSCMVEMCLKKCIDTEECREKGAELLEKSLLFVFVMVMACIPDYILVNYFLSF